MTAVLKSELNPLADAFIPASCRNTLQSNKNDQNLIKSENEMKTSREGCGKRNSNDLNHEYRKSKGIVIKLNNAFPPWKDIFFLSSLTSMMNMFFKSSNIDQKSLSILADSQLPMLTECPKSNDQERVQEFNENKTKCIEIIAEKDVCKCPPMFGWIIPPDFIGNPFNFRYECSKKYPHSPNCSEKCVSHTHKGSLDTKINDLTLDQCYSEIKDIITDVYETISIDSDPVAKWDEKYKIQDYLEISDTESDDEDNKESTSFNLDSTKVATSESELIDDGNHPLLQSIVTKEDGCDEKDLEKVEKFLAKSLSHSLPESLDVVSVNSDAICDPPCSIWCEYLPSAAKDTFKKYVQKTGSIKNCTKVAYHTSSSRARPLFKRSFSADDAPTFGRLKQGLCQNSINYREMLRRKDPLNCLRVRSSNELMDSKKYGSCELTDQQLLQNPDDESSMWGKFDGVDSLWQPLPDCMPFNVHNQRHNLYRKGRDARLQRNVS